MSSARLVRLAGVVAVAVMLVSLAAPYVGVLLAERAVAAAARERPADRGQGAASAGDDVDVLEPQAAADSGVRPLPLRSEGGEVDRLLTGDGPLDVEAMRGEVTRLAEELGVAEPVVDLLALDRYEVQYEVADDGGYRYEPIDMRISTALPDLGPDDEGTVLDLSAGLIAMAAADGGTEDHPGVTGAAIAYSLLRQVPLEPSCDLLTNAAYVLGLGVRPATRTVTTATRAAQEACGPDDPTPTWARAKYLASIATVGPDDPRSFLEAPSERRELAQAAFHELQTGFPQLPVGWAGEADLLLGWAAASDAVGAQPFQAAQWRETALELVAEARRVSADARLLLGQGRALLGLGRVDEAEAVLSEAASVLGAHLPLAVLRGEVAAARGDHPGAAEAVAAEAEARRPWWTSRPPIIAHADYLTGSYAVEEYPVVMVFDAAVEAFGGASVSDTGFIPTSRRTAPPVSCWRARQLDQLLLADDAQAVLGALDAGALPSDDWSAQTCGSVDFTPEHLRPETYRAMALTALGRLDDATDVLAAAEPASFTGEVRTLADPFERLQDLFRSAGDLDAARVVAEEWEAQLPEDPVAPQRLGEIAFLGGDLTSASAELDRAADLWKDQGAQHVPSADVFFPPSEGDELAQVLLQLGGTEYEAGRDASPALEEALSFTSPWEPDLPADTHSDLIRLHTLRVVGQVALDREDWQEAVGALEEARAIAEAFASQTYYGDPTAEMDLEENATGMASGAAENNLALAHARLGDAEQAEEAARAALSYDPGNPVYLDTLGFALQKGGEGEAAGEAYERAEAADETSYVSTTNRAVALAERGERAEAEAALLGVVAAHPEYAVGWHNLGVVWADSLNPVDALRAQGALGRAARLDAGLRGGRDLVMDDEVYRSGLDVARVEATSWRYGSSAAAVTERVTWSVVVLLLLRALWVLGLDRVTQGVSQRVLVARGERWRWWSASLSPQWALLLTVALLGGPLLWGSAGARGVWALVAVTGLVAAPLLVRSWLAERRRSAVRHRGWTPAMVTGALGSAVGLSFAPYPVLDDTERPLRAVRWAAPAALAVLGLLALLVAWTTGAPLPRILAANALVILASMLTPVPPLDGAALGGRRLQGLVTLLLAGGTLGLALQWV